MFTGLIRHLGTLDARRARPGGAVVRIGADGDLLARAEPGASIAVNGACLTAVARDEGAFEAELSEETLQKTLFGRMALGSTLHLEPSLRLGDPIDGHLVSGHVDGVGRLLEKPALEGLWRFAMPSEMAPLCASKGSIAVDGISLTVVECGRDWFTVAVIPETVKRTRFSALAVGSEVHLEGDPVGRYVARHLALRAGEANLARFAQQGWA
ncbi:MAG: riboflavin synthase [Firmicutes bacterium]|nr:riboflavin synthase [Bacillota bacterium]